MTNVIDFYKATNRLPVLPPSARLDQLVSELGESLANPDICYSRIHLIFPFNGIDLSNHTMTLDATDDSLSIFFLRKVVEEEVMETPSKESLDRLGRELASAKREVKAWLFVVLFLLIILNSLVWAV